jgi:hypothetical protein
MIKVEMNYRETECLYEYLKGCITQGPKTIDSEKEYLFACHIQQIMKRLFKKMGDVFSMGFNSAKKHKIKLEPPEVLSLYKYFNRYELPAFLFNIREQVYAYFKQNNNLLDIINQNKKYESTYKNTGFSFDWQDY